MGEALPYSRKTKRHPSITKRARVVTVVCLALAVALAFTGLFLKQQETAEAAAAEAASYTPAPLPTRAPVETVAVIGDSYTGGSKEGGLAGLNWVPLAEAKLRTEAERVVMNPEAAGGSGYVTEGPTGSTFPELVPAAVSANTDVVVFFGSRNDMLQDPARVTEAASAAYAEAKALAPDAAVLVIGAPWVSADVPPKIQAVNAALAEAASAAGATFIDPVAEGWFFTEPELIGSDGVHPTDAGHEYMAGMIAPHIREGLG